MICPPQSFAHLVPGLTVDSSGWIILDAQINVLLDSEPFDQGENG